MREVFPFIWWYAIHIYRVSGVQLVQKLMLSMKGGQCLFENLFQLSITVHSATEKLPAVRWAIHYNNYYGDYDVLLVQDMVEELISQLEVHADQSLRFLSCWLDFNEHYKSLAIKNSERMFKKKPRKILFVCSNPLLI